MKYTNLEIDQHISHLELLAEHEDVSPQLAAVLHRSAETIRQMRVANQPQKPVKESLADRNCPSCGAGIPFDALNEHIENAPLFCAHCGQQFDWSDEKGHKEW